MRQIIIDTETTGLEPKDHRIIEIGCVELINRQFTTNNNFHVYINPQRSIDSDAIAVHGITTEFLAAKPTFAEIIEDFLAYIDGAEIIAHNAPFDISFLNNELQLFGKNKLITDYVTVVDTLKLARKKHPGQRNSLDALCKRYKVDSTKRNLHGALLDARLLAEVYLRMTGGQTTLLDLIEPSELSESVNENGCGSEIPYSSDSKGRSSFDPEQKFKRKKALKIIVADETELKQHGAYLEKLKKIADKCLWEEEV